MISKYTHTLIISSTIRDALEKLSILGENLTLFIVENDYTLVGVVTDGDIRRGLIRGYVLEDCVKKIMNTDFKFLTEEKAALEQIGESKNFGSAKIIPVLNNKNKIVRFINTTEVKDILPIHAVIMAGGKGERLMPLTSKKPKPMLEVCGRPILEHNINLLKKYGIYNLYISVNYLKDEIINFFTNGHEWDLSIEYLDEKKPLGTLGSIKLTDKFKFEDILVMNSDVLTNINLTDFYLSFKKSNADMAIATTSYKINVPYAVLETHNGIVKSFKEKPTYTYFSNGGIYLIKRNIINEIPNGEFYNATDLINHLIDTNRVVVTFPILGYWLDIGRHEDYLKAQEDFKHIVF